MTLKANTHQLYHQSKISRIIFSVALFVYGLVTKILGLMEWIHREIAARYTYGNSNSVGDRQCKIEKVFGGLQKIPEKIVLSIKITQGILGINKNNELLEQREVCRSRIEEISESIMSLVEILGLIKIQEIVICLAGEASIEEIEANLQKSIVSLNKNTGNQFVNVTVLNWKKFHNELNGIQIKKYPNKTLVPLIICINNYRGLNPIPFTQLIDAQLVFCPNMPLSHKKHKVLIQKYLHEESSHQEAPSTKSYSKQMLYQLHKCLLQYASSVQRHGK